MPLFYTRAGFISTRVCMAGRPCGHTNRVIPGKFSKFDSMQSPRIMEPNELETLRRSRGDTKTNIGDGDQAQRKSRFMCFKVCSILEGEKPTEDPLDLGVPLQASDYEWDTNTHHSMWRNAIKRL